jgi:hypothetical protein
VLYTTSPTTTGRGVVVLSNVAPVSTNLLVVVDVFVPESTLLPTPVAAIKFGFGIGIVSLGTTINASPVLTVIFGYAILLYFEVKNLFTYCMEIYDLKNPFFYYNRNPRQLLFRLPFLYL